MTEVPLKYCACRAWSLAQGPSSLHTHRPTSVVGFYNAHRFLDAENAQCLGSDKDAWSASFDGSTAAVTLSNAAGVVTTTPTPLKVTHAVNCTAELPTLTLQLPTVAASTLLVGGYDVAAAFAKLGATLANASESSPTSPPPSSPPSPQHGTTTILAGSTLGFLDSNATSA